ncbi:MAG TPA: hypothetical protein VGS58_05450, partial [Candidatus Sulfopaludibacter sp.]|nr:hypothetical protein [Candidatus Sulfopaludibacter sp.]
MNMALDAGARRLGRFGMVALLAAGAAGAGDAHSELLANIRQHMAENLGRLPNYTCRETIERTSAPARSKHFTLVDRLRLEVAYVGGRELYAWPGEDRFEDRSIVEIVGKGAAIGAGNFAMHARAVFTTNAPVFAWGGEAERGGRRVVRFDFTVAREKSRYAIETAGAPEFVAYTGFVEADAETLDPLRLAVEAADLPPDLLLAGAGEIMEYGRVRIGDSNFLLPQSSELTMRGINGVEDRNQARFESCRDFAGESTVRFDVDETATAGGTATAPIVLPRGLTVETSLREPINKLDYARGDMVHAVVTRDVKKSGQVMVPKGAVITGRVTRAFTDTFRSLVYFGVGLRFHAIEFAGRRGDFAGSVEVAGIGGDYSAGVDKAT